MSGVSAKVRLNSDCYLISCVYVGMLIGSEGRKWVVVIPGVYMEILRVGTRAFYCIFTRVYCYFLLISAACPTFFVMSMLLRCHSKQILQRENTTTNTKVKKKKE